MALRQDPKTVLACAKKKLTDETWIQNDLAENKDEERIGEETFEESPRKFSDAAAKFCSIGAVYVCVGSSFEEDEPITPGHRVFSSNMPEYMALQEAVKRITNGDKFSIADWNDEEGRTLEEVHAMFDLAIEIASKEDA